MTEQPTFFAPPVDYDSPEARTAAIAVLLGAAETTTEINALTRVARRAGFLWSCPSCRADVYPGREVCGCGARRSSA